MMQNDPDGLRKSASKNFTDKLNSSIDQAGVVSWDNDIDFVQQLTNNFTLVKTMIDRVDSDGGTNLDVGLRASIDELTSPRARMNATRTMIFLTDGEGDYTRSGQPGSQTDRARNAGVVIFTIGLTIAQGSQPERDLMEIASVTGGFYFSAPNATSLDRIFNIITNLTTMYVLCSCQAITVPGNYVLANDIRASGSCMAINAPNSTLDCRGRTVSGNGTAGTVGIFLNATDGASIRNCKIEGFDAGIQTFRGIRALIFNNTLVRNTYGIGDPWTFWGFVNSEISQNLIAQNSHGLFFPRVTVSNPRFYNNSVIKNIIINNTHGVHIDWSIVSSYKDNKVANNEYGFYMRFVEFNWHVNNSITNNSVGIFINNPLYDGGTIANNSIARNGEGIHAEYDGDPRFPPSHSLNVNSNFIINNMNGISFSSIRDSTIYNNLFNNTINAISNGVNTWNIGATAGPNIVGGPLISGNFWHDYMGVDLNGDGIGDTLLPHTSNWQIVGGDSGPLAGQPTLVMSGVPRIGSTATFTLNDRWHPDYQYILAFSLGSTPGISLPDGRTIHLNPDPLLILSLQSPTSIGLQNSIGALNANGQAVATWNIPNVPELAGIRISAVFVTIRSGAPLPVPIPSISPALEIQLLP